MGVFSWAQGVLPIRSFTIFLCAFQSLSRSGLWEGVPAGLLIAAYIWLQVALPCHWGPHPQAPSLWGPGCGAVGLLALYALNPGYTYTRVTSSAQFIDLSQHSSKRALSRDLDRGAK